MRRECLRQPAGLPGIAVRGHRLGEQHEAAQPVGRAQELGEAVPGQRGDGRAGGLSMAAGVLGPGEHRLPHGQPRVAGGVVTQRDERDRLRVAPLEREREALDGVLLVGVVAVAAVELDRLLGQPLALFEAPGEERHRRLEDEQAPAVVRAPALGRQPLQAAELLARGGDVAGLERIAQP